MPGIRGYSLPGDVAFRKKIELFSFAQHLRDAVIAQFRFGSAFLDCHSNTDAGLNAENIVRCSREFRVAAHVAVKVDVIYPLEILREVLAHSVKCQLIDKAVIRYEADDPVAAAQAVGRPAEELDVHIRKRILVGRFRVFRVCIANTGVHDLVLSVSIVVVFAFLPNIVWGVADDYGDGGFLLPLDAIGISGREEPDCLPSAISSVSTKQRPSNGSYACARS